MKKEKIVYCSCRCGNEMGLFHVADRNGNAGALITISPRGTSDIARITSHTIILESEEVRMLKDWLEVGDE